ncbi:hypothetical protein SAMN06265348_104374 [Pedobacter westerhofensis]|uniref:Uncharacterized protein n=1 Tax=Pedobacter westerhofensis TaxID=425512 RepID=A0A521D023_9SPHI|nr:hypothetical protein SAMN06265348_104374 [Pedobacter westerhofensis]
MQIYNNYLELKLISRALRALNRIILLPLFEVLKIVKLFGEGNKFFLFRFSKIMLNFILYPRIPFDPFQLWVAPLASVDGFYVRFNLSSESKGEIDGDRFATYQ